MIRSTRTGGVALTFALAIATGITAGIAAGIAAGAHAEVARSPAPDGAEVYFITPADGDVVKPTFTVRFGLSGMGVAPAGIEKDATGHHHLLIDIAPDALDMNAPLPANDNVVHFGGGQTETEVTLAPGEHTLTLILGNYLHIPHDPPVVSDTITVTVEE